MGAVGRTSLSQAGPIRAWLLFQTRMVASATQANLTLDVARPALVEKLSKSLAGIL
jgi:hypothetical protein